MKMTFQSAGTPLVGLLAPERGAIELDGVALDGAERLARIALVPQDPVLLAPTVREEPFYHLHTTAL